MSIQVPLSQGLDVPSMLGDGPGIVYDGLDSLEFALCDCCIDGVQLVRGKGLLLHCPDQGTPHLQIVTCMW